MNRQGARVRFQGRAKVLAVGLRPRLLAKAQRALPKIEAIVRNRSGSSCVQQELRGGEVVVLTFSVLALDKMGDRQLNIPVIPRPTGSSAPDLEFSRGVGQDLTTPCDMLGLRRGGADTSKVPSTPNAGSPRVAVLAKTGNLGKVMYSDRDIEAASEVTIQRGSSFVRQYPSAPARPGA